MPDKNEIDKQTYYKKLGSDHDHIGRKSSMFYPYDSSNDLNEPDQKTSKTKDKLSKAVSNMKKLFGF